MNFKYVTQNALALQYKRRKQLHIWLAGLIALALLFIDPIISVLFYVASIFTTPDNWQFRAGARGEIMALGQDYLYDGSLGELGDEYCVYTNVVIPAGNTTCEIDILVVGPNGFFIVEVKHMSGKIIGQADSKTWLQSKRPHSRQFRNPIKQVNRQVYWLKQLLDQSNIKTWIEPIVVFTHPRVQLDVFSEKVTVIPLGSLSTIIQFYRPRFLSRMPGLPNIMLRDVITAMYNPPGNVLRYKSIAAQLTGRRDWMVDFNPFPIRRYHNRDVIDPKQKIADIMGTRPAPQRKKPTKRCRRNVHSDT